MFVLNPQSGVPIYRQLVEQIRRLAASGHLKPGDVLPSVRELAVEHAVNPMTISKAYGLLESEGVLLRQRGKPMQIAALRKSRKTEHELLDSLTPQIEQLILAARQLQLSDEILLDGIREVLANNDNH